MLSARLLVSASLLLLAAVSAAPAASADEVWACVGYKPAMCEGNAVLVVEHNGARVLDACVILVAGSCDPYEGHLVRAHVDGQEIVVRDPCYTTACW
jgi:hypothetical protein